MTQPEPVPARPTGVGLRERKKARTRRELTDVAYRLFAERGYDNVTAEEIAATADVSLRTFYRYFPSKEQLLLADSDDSLLSLRAAFDARPAEEPAFTALRRAILNLSIEYADQRDRLLQRSQIIASKPSLGTRSPERQIAWENGVTELLAGRMDVDPDTDLRPRVAAAASLAAMRVAVQRWLDGGGNDDLAGLVDQALDLIADGFTETRPVG